MHLQEEYAPSMIWPWNDTKSQQLTHDAAKATLSNKGSYWHTFH